MLKQIEKDMMEALKNKNKEKAGALRLLISKCKNKAIEVGHELSDSEVIKVLQTAAKQHKESIRMYKEGNRDDLVEAEMNELQFVESYLPSMMNEEEVRSLVENIISEVEECAWKTLKNGQTFRRFNLCLEKKLAQK